VGCDPNDMCRLGNSPLRARLQIVHTTSRGWVAFLVVLIALLSRPGSAIAQELARTPIDSGTLVRMHLSETESARGRLLRTFSQGSASLTYCQYPTATPCSSLTDTRAHTIDASQLLAIEVADGTHLARGLVIGGLIGTAIGVVYAGLEGGLCESNCADPAVAIAAGAGWGLALGALFGSQSTRWKPAM
jgi:hypothetical protein